MELFQPWHILILLLVVVIPLGIVAWVVSIFDRRQRRKFPLHYPPPPLFDAATHKFCSECGRQIARPAAFCSFCGAKTS